MDAAAFRAEFPVLERYAYLNAGTTGPAPQRALDAVRERLELEGREGRSGYEYFSSTIGLAQSARAAYAAVLGCDPEHAALTGSTTDGVNTVLSGLDLRHGEEILTSDEEHPGLLAPLARARRKYGVHLREVPFSELAAEVGAATRLVACSHVSWVSGQVADVAALKATGAPILLDAAQALGAIPVDVNALGCDFYACSGQKWLCGPEGSGCLFVHPQWLDELVIPWPSFGSLADPSRPLDFEPAQGAARFDHGFPAGLRNTWALAALDLFSAAGWEWIHERAATLAAELAEELARRGLEVLPRGRSTLVSFVSAAADPAEDVARLAEQQLVTRYIPGRGLIRVSVGAWNSEEELERLVAAVTP
jgi:selenocysteine lyase/cysteine desulfurase